MNATASATKVTTKRFQQFLKANRKAKNKRHKPHNFPQNYPCYTGPFYKFSWDTFLDKWMNGSVLNPPMKRRAAIKKLLLNIKKSRKKITAKMLDEQVKEFERMGFIYVN